MSKTEKHFEYLLLGHFQSDSIEGEFGVFRQASGGNYYISYEQFLSNLIIRIFKLFAQLDVPYSNENQNYQCCMKDLGEEEIELLDKCVEIADTLTETE